MHRVIQSHVDAFKGNHSLALVDSKAFESFCAFTLSMLYSSDMVEPETMIYEGHDPGIDSVLIFVNDRYISTPDELASIFQNRRSDNDVQVVFIQAKTVDYWEKKKSITSNLRFWTLSLISRLIFCPKGYWS